MINIGSGVSDDMMFFNGKVWKSIKDYSEHNKDRVLQYNLDGSATLVYPSEYMRLLNSDPINVYNINGIHMDVTSGQNILYMERSTGELRLIESGMIPLDFSVPVISNCCYLTESGEDVESFKEIIDLFNQYSTDGILFESSYDPGIFSKLDILNYSRPSRIELLKGIFKGEKSYYTHSKECASYLYDILSLSGEIARMICYVRHTAYKVDWVSRDDEDTSVYGKVNCTKELSVVDWKEEVGRFNKYSFIVPSGMVVYKCRGTLIVLGDGRKVK